MKKREPKWYIDNKLKPPKAFFDWCYSQIHTYKWSNKQKTILASNRKNCYVVEKRLTKRTNLNFFDMFRSFGIVLSTSKRIEIQSYCFWSRIIDGKQLIEMELINFEQFADGQHIKIGGFGRNNWRYDLVPNTQYGGPYSSTRFYEDDWEEKIMHKSELRYLEFERGIEVFEIENIYKYRSEIEFLQKIRARKLADEVMYPNYHLSYTGWGVTKSVDMRTINHKWLKENKPFFKNSDRSFKEYEIERRVKARKGKVVPGIEEYLNYRDINKIPTGVGIISFQNWIIKNKVDFKYYLDYIGLLKDLDIKVDSKNLIMPKDLKKAHDNAVELFTQMKREIEDKQYKKRVKSVLKLEKEIDGYAIVAPKVLNELVAEGKALHHCVGGSSYVEGHKKGKTTILFIRSKEEPNKPLFTMEYKSGQIIQIRGKHNQSPPEEVKQAADHWLQEITKRKKVGAA